MAIRNKVTYNNQTSWVQKHNHNYLITVSKCRKDLLILKDTAETAAFWYAAASSRLVISLSIYNLKYYKTTINTHTLY